MCDTLVALGDATADGSVVFAKNSDREPNEAHHLVIIPAADHRPGSTVRCTYLELPQVEATHAVLLAKPFWIWGAEMGANEHGLVIGNEAVFTKVPYDKGPGLTGMDLLRLALERADSARDGLKVITGLIETYGQGGGCGFTRKLYYHNSFILADHAEAWVLETAGRHWAAKRVETAASISNALTIDRDWDLASAELADYAVDQGWCKSREDFSFARCYSDFLFTKFSAARHRRSRTAELLAAAKGRIDPATAMSILRDHGPAAGVKWTPGPGLLGAEVCMHAGFGPVRISQTTGSMVSHLKDGLATHWLTGTAAPCTSIFKPVWLDSGLPDLGPEPKGEYDETALWWRHESLHRAVLHDYSVNLPLYKDERDALEETFLRRAAEAAGGTVRERAELTARCFARADEALTEWTERVSTAKSDRRPWLYRLAWRGFNRRAKMPG